MSIRLEKLRAYMKSEGIDAVVITSKENHMYLSGFNNPDGALLVSLDSAWALEDFRYIEAAKREISAEDFTVIQPDVRFFTWIGETVSEHLLKTVAFEDLHLTYSSYGLLKKACNGSELVPLGKTLINHRAVKDENEVQCIRQAQSIAETAFAQLLGEINTDCTESYLAARLDFLMKKNGSEGEAFETIAVSGKNSSSPHGVPRNVKIEKGFLTFDFGATVQGYRSDMTRTVCIGKADDRMKELYNKVLEAQTAVLSVIGEGQSLFKMDKIARDIIDAVPFYKGAFGHSLGHGVGLEIHESPNMSPLSGGDKLVLGNVVTVEPGIYLAGKYGCRIEDMVYITKGGAENLTKCPKELLEL